MAGSGHSMSQLGAQHVEVQDQDGLQSMLQEALHGVHVILQTSPVLVWFGEDLPYYVEVMVAIKTTLINIRRCSDFYVVLSFVSRVEDIFKILSKLEDIFYPI